MDNWENRSYIDDDNNLVTLYQDSQFDVFDIINFDSSQNLNTIISSVLSSLQEKIVIN